MTDGLDEEVEVDEIMISDTLLVKTGVKSFSCWYYIRKWDNTN